MRITIGKKATRQIGRNIETPMNSRATHESSRTTGLYDRGDDVSLAHTKILPGIHCDLRVFLKDLSYSLILARPVG
jgi:hypothetical protein